MTFQVPSTSTRNLLDQACRIYEKDLKGSVAEKYLLKRGLTKEVMTYFRLGYVDPSVDRFPGHEFQENRLAIPYITPTGIVQMRFRAVPFDGEIGGPEDSPKYKSIAHTSVTMFNTRDFASEGTIAVCEGELDAISAHMAGIPAIGIPGASNWQKVFARAFRFRKVVILADNDDKGDGLKFAEKVQADIKGSRIILMDEGYDVNKFIQDFGIQELRKKVGLKDDS